LQDIKRFSVEFLRMAIDDMQIILITSVPFEELQICPDRQLDKSGTTILTFCVFVNKVEELPRKCD